MTRKIIFECNRRPAHKRYKGANYVNNLEKRERERKRERGRREIDRWIDR